MRQLLAVLVCLISVNMLGQALDYDGDDDGCVNINDLLGLLTELGQCEDNESFTCGELIEHEGYYYSTVQIGDQCWFSENCRHLPEVSPSSEGSSTEPYYYVYGYDGTDVVAATSTSNYDTYGVLYNWAAVMTDGICPSGWHIPLEAEWQTMEMTLGMSEAEATGTGWRGTDEGHQIKSTSGWNDGGNGSNSSGINALPGGYRLTGGFNVSGSSCYWRSSSESGSPSWVRVMDYDYDQVYRYNGITNLHLGFSARCVKD